LDGDMSSIAAVQMGQVRCRGGPAQACMHVVKNAIWLTKLQQSHIRFESVRMHMGTQNTIGSLKQSYWDHE
jgi:hypothetical protein